MSTTYRAVMLTGKGGPKALDVLKVVDLPVPEPGPGQLRVRVRAAGVGSTDLMAVGGSYRYGPSIPFVPGYEIAGVIDAHERQQWHERQRRGRQRRHPCLGKLPGWHHGL